jgi:hypothetical protein
MKKLAEKRPTEIVSGLAIAGAVYGFLAEGGVPNPVAAGVGAVLGFGPLVVSRTVDALRRPQ